ncbi:hypothetical protein Nepgr_022146 [Nepenthes gracilis]|uniref:Uncharacterized protein n=1 Tax=Nepenthes gracilis TaxID=150966 RepID=A0AAD3T027_NEPGR|nr:hypothetical protein Nepgr_022146 [Nepenthes gracilis]
MFNLCCHLSELLNVNKNSLSGCICMDCELLPGEGFLLNPSTSHTSIYWQAKEDDGIVDLSTSLRALHAQDYHPTHLWRLGILLRSLESNFLYNFLVSLMPCVARWMMEMKMIVCQWRKRQIKVRTC